MDVCVAICGHIKAGLRVAAHSIFVGIYSLKEVRSWKDEWTDLACIHTHIHIYIYTYMFSYGHMYGYVWPYVAI